MPDDKGKQVVIVGAGQAAIQLAQNLRTQGHLGPITMIGDENYPAYQRPPLSKAFMKGDMAEGKLFLKPLSFYENKAVSLKTGTRVTAVDRQARTVACDDGTQVPYDHLVLATGARPRMPAELAGIGGVLALRGLDDAKRLRAEVGTAKRLVVLGGGYIGLEAAAVFSAMGLDVVVLERLPRLLARVTGDTVADYFLRLHKHNGVKVLCDAEVTSYDTEGGHISALTLKDGRTVPADLMLVGIGVLPNQELAADAGLTCDNGIVVDEDGLTDDPHIYAIGDCSRRPMAGQDTKLRLESVPNAIDQADIVSAHILGRDRPPHNPPWFWSDQYQTKIQTVGLFSGHTETMVRGDAGEGPFSVFYFRHGRFIAVDAVNDPPSFMAAKQILKLGLGLTPSHLADATVPMAQILATLKQA